jgi:hypothetical protein
MKKIQIFDLVVIFLLLIGTYFAQQFIDINKYVIWIIVLIVFLLIMLLSVLFIKNKDYVANSSIEEKCDYIAYEESIKKQLKKTLTPIQLKILQFGLAESLIYQNQLEEAKTKIENIYDSENPEMQLQLSYLRTSLLTLIDFLQNNFAISDYEIHFKMLPLKIQSRDLNSPNSLFTLFHNVIALNNENALDLYCNFLDKPMTNLARALHLYFLIQYLNNNDLKSDLYIEKLHKIKGNIFILTSF